MSEPGNGHFDRLTEGLSSDQRIEFFRTLHEAGIADDDVELVQLLRALQLYKAFYEEIPGRVREAVEEASILGARIKSLHDGIAQHLDNALAQLKQNTEASSEISAEFRDTQTHLAAAVEKSAGDIARSLESELRTALSAVVLKPFESCLSDIRDQCSRTASQAKQVTNELKLARRIHIGAYVLASAIISVILTLAGWFVSARYYSQREGEFLQRINQNREVVSELARKRAVLEPRRDPTDSEKVYLLVKKAKTWTTDRHLVVEVK
jgi:hypothetical protein